MQEQNINNEGEFTPYEIPPNVITESSDKTTIGSSSVSDIITATGNLKSENFWMVVMIIIMLALGGGAVFWITNLYTQLAQKEMRIVQLEKELKEAPDKAIEQLKEMHRTVQELRGEIKTTRTQLNDSNKELLETNDKLKQIETGL